MDLAAWDLVLVIGRPGWRLGVRERDRMAALARLADERWVDVSEREARSAAGQPEHGLERRLRHDGSPLERPL